MQKLFVIILLIITNGATAMATEPNQTKRNAHSFTFKNAKKGDPINLANYKDKVVLIVNTASQCGFTGQYENMQKLYEEYASKGLVVIAVPSNDFGSQEPDNEAQICEFVAKKFNITFPITAKYKVKGNDAHDFYKWARENSSIMGAPKWNFHKYLIDKNGQLATWYASTTKPDAKKVKAKIDELLQSE